MKIENCLSVPEASRVVNVSRQTLYTWMNRGVLPYLKKGAQRLILLDALVTADNLMKKLGAKNRKKR